jgi:type II secretory pathway component HofQ
VSPPTVPSGAGPRSAALRVAGRTCLAAGLWGVLGGLGFGQTPQRPGQMPTLPLTQLDERAPEADLDTRPLTVAFSQPTPIRDLLLLIVRGTNLSIVPDPSIAGAFIGDLKNVTVRQALDLVLPPLGLDYAVDGSFIRVFRREPETRMFDVNYSAVERSGASTIGTGGTSQTSAAVSTSTRTDVFADLANGVRSLLSEHATFSVDRKAGLLQVTDFPERLDRVGLYLDAVQDRVHRQAQIDARVIEVELSDDKAEGIDWTRVATRLSGGEPAGQRSARPSLTGLRVTDIGRLLEALAEQGKVETVASPRMLTLNNEPAIVRTDAVTFSVTPQIAGDAAVTLSLSPIVKVPTTAESDLLARVADGETLVVSGFTRARETRERKNVGLGGGWFGRSTVVTRRHLELVILLTPRIVPGAMAQ